MTTTFTKEEFKVLDFDTKCVLMEELLTNDFFQGQADIDFYFVDPENKDILPPKTSDQQESEDREFDALLERLTNKLFDNKTTIELHIDKYLQE